MKQLKYSLFVAVGMAFSMSAIAQTYISHTINQPPQLVADAGQALNVCVGDSVQLGGNPAGAGGTAPLNYAWSPPTGLSSVSVANPMASPGGSTTYSLQITDAENCTQNSSVAVTVVTPTAAFTSTTNLLVANFTDQSANATTWSWTFGDGGTSTLQNPSHTYTAEGTYQVCLTINAGTGCEQMTCDSVTVIAVGLANGLPGVGILVYPNPVTGNAVNFELQGTSLDHAVVIEWMDVQGRIVMRYEGPAGQAIHTLGRKDLAAGTYQYRVQAGDVLLGSGKVVLRSHVVLSYLSVRNSRQRLAANSFL